MITVTHPVVSVFLKAAVKVKRYFQRFVQTVLDARMRRIRYETEFHRRFNDYRRANNMPPFVERDL